MNKNLNFCPRPNQYNKNELNEDLLKFYRNLKLKAHFGNQPLDKETFRPKRQSTWTPPKTSHEIQTFITAAGNDINEAPRKATPKDNLNKKEREAIKNLQERDDIIITKADKGGAVVIWNTNDYIEEANRQLNDASAYKKLDADPTEKICKIH